MRLKGVITFPLYLSWISAFIKMFMGWDSIFLNKKQILQNVHGMEYQTYHLVSTVFSRHMIHTLCLNFSLTLLHQHTRGCLHSFCVFFFPQYYIHQQEVSLFKKKVGGQREISVLATKGGSMSLYRLEPQTFRLQAGKEYNQMGQFDYSNVCNFGKLFSIVNFWPTIDVCVKNTRTKQCVTTNKTTRYSWGCQTHVSGELVAREQNFEKDSCFFFTIYIDFNSIQRQQFLLLGFLVSLICKVYYMESSFDKGTCLSLVDVEFSPWPFGSLVRIWNGANAYFPRSARQRTIVST